MTTSLLADSFEVTLPDSDISHPASSVREDTRKRGRKKISPRRRLIGNVVFFGLLLGVFVFRPGDRMFFHPSDEAFSQLRQWGPEAEELFIESASGTRVHTWFLPASNPEAGIAPTIVHAHGNAENLTSHISQTAWLTNEGYNVLVFDYPGYGQSTGRPTRESCISATIAAIEQAQEHPRTRKDQVALIGQSLGGAISLAAISKSRPELQCIIVDSSFARYREVANSAVGGTAITRPLVWLFVSAGYDPADSPWLPEGAQVLHIQGSADRVVRPSNGGSLHNALSEAAQSANANYEFLRVDEADHLEALYRDEVRERVLEVLKTAFERDGHSD